MTPACAQACPTASIQFGPIQELRQRADARVATLQAQNVPAYIYGDETMLGGLNAFSLLIDKPEVYGLPVNPKMPSRNLWPSSLFSIGGRRRGRACWGCSASAEDRMARAGRRPGRVAARVRGGCRCRLTPSSPRRRNGAGW